MVAFTLKLENLKIVADMVGRQVYLLVCESVFNMLFRESVVIVVALRCRPRGWRLVYCV